MKSPIRSFPPAADRELRLLGRSASGRLPLVRLLEPFGGLGLRSAAAFATLLGLGPRLPAGRRPQLMGRLEARLSALRLDRTLRRWEQARIQAKRRLATAAGRRHLEGLPVRGQRTHSNGRTARRQLRSPASVR